MHTGNTRNTVLAKLTPPIMGFAFLGAFSFGLACVLLLLRPDALSGDPTRGSVLVLTHVITLGWIASVLFAGIYLLGPILAGSPLWSHRLPVFHLACHAIGLALLLGGLAMSHWPAVGQGALVLCVGIVSLVVNLLITAGKRSLWSPANLGFQASIFWLMVTGGVALFMLWARHNESTRFGPELLIALHAHYALFGFLAQALLAASLRIVPELLGIEAMPRWINVPGWFGWILLNAGLFFLPMVQTFSATSILTSGIFIALGILGFAIQIGCYLLLPTARLNWGAATHFTGIGLLLLITGGALWSFPMPGEDAVLSLRSWMQLYISLSLLGPFAFAILGTGERLVPRLVWHLRFAPWSGYAQLPKPTSLIREAAGAPMFFSLLMAWVYLVMGQMEDAATATRLGSVLMLVAFGWFLIAVSPALRHLALGVTPADLSGLNQPLGETAQADAATHYPQKHQEPHDENRS